MDSVMLDSFALSSLSLFLSFSLSDMCILVVRVLTWRDTVTGHYRRSCTSLSQLQSQSAVTIVMEARGLATGRDGQLFRSEQHSGSVH